MGGRSLDKFQEAFSDFLTQSPIVDMEIGNGWFTWNKKRGGDHLVASCLDIFLVSKYIVNGMGEMQKMFSLLQVLTTGLFASTGIG